jgi:UDP-2,3-diacylglucosamine pyrophosphatase LpxH
MRAIRRRLNDPYWSLAHFLKLRIGQAAAYIARFEAAVARSARHRGFDGVICGHIHKAAECPLYLSASASQSTKSQQAFINMVGLFSHLRVHAP